MRNEFEDHEKHQDESSIRSVFENDKAGTKRTASEERTAQTTEQGARSFRADYQEMMGRVSVDAEMRERVLSAIGQADLSLESTDPKKARKEWIHLVLNRHIPVFVMAALLMIVMIVVPWSRGSKSETTTYEMAAEAPAAAADSYEEAATEAPEAEVETYEEATADTEEGAPALAEATPEVAVPAAGEEMEASESDAAEPEMMVGSAAEEDTAQEAEVELTEAPAASHQNIFVRIFRTILFWIRKLFHL